MWRWLNCLFMWVSSGLGRGLIWKIRVFSVVFRFLYVGLMKFCSVVEVLRKSGLVCWLWLFLLCSSVLVMRVGVFMVKWKFCGICLVWCWYLVVVSGW